MRKIERIMVQGLSNHRLVQRLAALGLAFTLGGCSFAGDRLFPDFMGGDETTAEAAPESAAAAPVAPVQAQAQAAYTPTPSFTGTTVVGQRVGQFMAEFQQLSANTQSRSAQLDAVRSQTVSNVSSYHSLVGGIRSRLQMGSTPGNPELLAQWSQAQAQLSQVDADIATLNQLSAQVAADAASSSYLLENIRSAYSLTGAIEEDHRQLRLLEDAANQNAIIIDRSLLSLNDEITRQQQYVSTERGALVSLASEINAGRIAGARAMAGRSASASMPVGTTSPAAFAERRPLVVIRFDRADVTYEPALYQALSRALERRPDAVFDLVAVSPAGGASSSARANADAVLRSMTNMGLPMDRIAQATMSSPSASSPEVHVYVR